MSKSTPKRRDSKAWVFSDSSETKGACGKYLQQLLKYSELFEGNGVPYCLGNLKDSGVGYFVCFLYGGLEMNRWKEASGTAPARLFRVV